MGFIKEMILRMLGKKKIIGYVGAAVIAGGAFVIGEPVVFVKDAICDAPVVEVPESIREKSPLNKDDKKEDAEQPK